MTMPYPKYFVSYCMMSSEAGANPFGHACILLSQQNDQTSPIQVIDAFGFYAQPSSSTDKIICALKRLLGFNINLQSSHGMLTREPMRYLDTDGLYEVSFQINDKTFQDIIATCQTEIKNQEIAMAELDQMLKQHNIPCDGHSRLVLENYLAQKQRRKPRLREFNFSVELSPFGLDTTASHTCKDRALNILLTHQVISNSLASEISSSRFNKAFPRYSDLPLQPVKFIPEGVPNHHISDRTGKKYYFFEWEKHSLYFATPIHLINQKYLYSPPDHNKLKTTLNQLFKMRNHLYQLVESLDNEKTTTTHPYVDQLKQIEITIQSFKKADLIPVSKELNKKISCAEKTLAMAEACLEPEKFRASFLLRAIQNPNVYQSLVGLVFVSAAIASLGASPVGITASTLGVLYSSCNIYGFYQSESMHAKKMAFLHPAVNLQLHETQPTSGHKI